LDEKRGIRKKDWSKSKAVRGKKKKRKAATSQWDSHRGGHVKKKRGGKGG